MSLTATGVRALAGHLTAVIIALQLVRRHRTLPAGDRKIIEAGLRSALAMRALLPPRRGSGP
jgi:hypothetical protein